MKETFVMPTVALRDIVVFPGTTVSFDIERKTSKAAIDKALKTDGKIFLVTQRYLFQENTEEADLFHVGCVAKIVQYGKITNQISRIMVEVISRAKIDYIVERSPYIIAEFTTIEEKKADNPALNTAYMRTLKEMYSIYILTPKRISEPSVPIDMKAEEIGKYAYNIMTKVACEYYVKQEILEENDLYKRLEMIVEAIKNEIDILTLQQEIKEEVKKKIDENQREYYLREELKVIENELGDMDDSHDEIIQYKLKIKKCRFPEETENRLLADAEKIKKIPVGSPEGTVIRSYLDNVLALPWQTQSKDRANIKAAEEILNKDHYGLEKVKERILEFLSVHSLTNGGDGTVLCLSGPPGTGKTSIASSIAKALGRKFVRISLGGLHDEAEIRGHRKTYIGSMPGRIIDAVKQAGTKNPVILLDEIDKIGSDYKGDPTSALLEVLDFEQNSTFRDNYVEIPFDLSQVIFIATANNINNIPLPLLDRVELIEIPGYTNPEKFEIAKRYLVKKCIAKNGLKGKKVSVADDAVRDIINYYTREAGVRGLERKISELMRKIAKSVISDEKKNTKITSKNLTEYLGKHIYDVNMMNEEDEVGTVRGLAWTSVGGDTLSVEVNVMEGSGKIELTGNLGDVMKESCMTAVSYIRSRSDELNIDKTFYKTKDIHIHVPEGAVPKDGPSAGITIATAVASALCNKPVKCDVAMTGEITLRGNVLPIGGLREKSLAAYRAGIKTVIIPDKNVNDIEEIPEDVRSEINFIPVKNMETVLANSLR
ncbi:MAG: endopeptidase La [Clostridia bacterium]|nr:endopeptidase La [Clostridia bacterium]